jgi:uncharacterized protein (TIGR03435 family)
MVGATCEPRPRPITCSGAKLIYHRFGQFIVLALASSALVAYGQNTPANQAFEVASVKVSTGIGAAGYPRTVNIPDPNRVSARNASLRLLIEFAYDVRDFQIAGAEWVDSIRYDVEAKADRARTSAELRHMLQQLLLDRFDLGLHRETRDIPVLEMTVAKGGPKVSVRRTHLERAP